MLLLEKPIAEGRSNGRLKLTFAGAQFSRSEFGGPGGGETMITSSGGAAVQFGSVVPHMAVPDVVRTAEHYRDILGFEIAGYWDGEEVHHDPARKAVFGIVRRGEASIHFNRGRLRMPSRLSAGAYDLYFEVTNVHVLADELRGRGAEILDGPEERVYGQRELIVRDCNGFVLAFASSDRDFAPASPSHE